MDAQELRNLQEAYMEVVENQQLDEVEGSYGQTPKATAAYASLLNKRKRTPASQYSKKGEKTKKVDAAERHLKRSSKVEDDDNWTISGGKLHKFKKSPRPHPRPDEYARRNMDAEMRAASREASNYGHYTDDIRFDNPSYKPGGMPKGKKLERQRKTGVSAESYDIYDIILSHLLDEGYADTQETAEAIMVHMSEEWRQGIVEAYVPLRTSDETHDDEGFPTTTRNWSRALTHARIAVGKEKFRGRTTGTSNVAKGVAASRRLEAMKKVDAEPESVRAKKSQAKSQANQQLGANRRRLQTALDREHLQRSFNAS